MNYQTYAPHPDLDALISCFWTLEVAADPDVQKQRIVPDGTIEMAFLLGDDIRRYTSEKTFILQPRSMVIGQTMEPFYIEPTGYVKTFAVRFYPYGFAHFVSCSLSSLANKETPLKEVFDSDTAKTLEQQIVQAKDTSERIALIEQFLLDQLNAPSTIDTIVKTTIDTLLESNGNTSIISILKKDASQRRQLERKFSKQIGISPKQLGKLIRLQSALKMMLHENGENLTQIAYENAYYDQAHFIKDFKAFTGITPKEFLGSENMILSAAFYK